MKKYKIRRTVLARCIYMFKPIAVDKGFVKNRSRTEFCRRQHAFYSFIGDAVKLAEKGRVTEAEHMRRRFRLIPHRKEPGGDRICAVPVNDMAHKLCDKFSPFFVGAGLADYGGTEKCALFGITRKARGH